MSKGTGAFANLTAEDSVSFVYEYGDYNLNDAVCRNRDRVADGYITIIKSCLTEPETHEKIRKTTNGKKTVIKRIPLDVDFYSMIRNHGITIENCSTYFETSADVEGADAMAIHLISKFFRIYQEEGNIPEKITYDI